MKKLRVTVNGVTYEVEVELIEDDESEGFLPQFSQNHIAPQPIAQQSAPVMQKQVAKKAVPTSGGGDNITAPMAGNITTIHAKVGDNVKANDLVVEMEAMKMITKLTAPKDGKVSSINVKVGDNVDQGAILVEID